MAELLDQTRFVLIAEGGTFTLVQRGRGNAKDAALIFAAMTRLPVTILYRNPETDAWEEPVADSGTV